MQTCVKILNIKDNFMLRIFLITDVVNLSTDIDITDDFTDSAIYPDQLNINSNDVFSK
jgi:hypothetical protein